MWYSTPGSEEKNDPRMFFEAETVAYSSLGGRKNNRVRNLPFKIEN
jgi:hypothetical protein